MMKKYDVYGIGSALVDLDFEIPVQFLLDIGVEKGLMTLIEAHRHHELLEQLKHLPHKISCAGSMANSLIAIAQLGGRSFYACTIADDHVGRIYQEDLRKWGIDSSLDHHPLLEGHTGKCLVFVTPDADRTMNTYLGIAQELSEKQIHVEALKASQYVYIEGYLVSASESAYRTAIKTRLLAKEHGIKTALSLSDPNMTQYFKSPLLALIDEKIDLLLCNLDEALSFTQSTDLNQAIEKLKTVAKQFAITLGAKGAIIFDGHRQYDLPANPIVPIDTVGAGDMFAGTLLLGLCRGYSLHEAGLLANHAAALIVNQIGPRLSDAKVEQLRALI